MCHDRYNLTLMSYVHQNGTAFYNKVCTRAILIPFWRFENQKETKQQDKNSQTRFIEVW